MANGVRIAEDDKEVNAREFIEHNIIAGQAPEQPLVKILRKCPSTRMRQNLERHLMKTKNKSSPARDGVSRWLLKIFCNTRLG